MKTQCLYVTVILVCISLLAGCQNNEVVAQSPNDFRGDHFYATSVKYTAENESDERYLEIAQRSYDMFRLLETNADAFVMDAYNYQTIDAQGNLLYTANTHDLPIEIDSAGYCINVSVNYFHYNPIETVSGQPIEQQMVRADTAQNILVPEGYSRYEQEILEEYRRLFYFEKVEVANLYNKAVGAPEDETALEELSVNIIYAKDDQEYFTYRNDLARPTNNVITNPVVRIYTGNTHVSYAHSYMTQFISFYSEAGDAAGAYVDIFPCIQQAGAEESVQAVRMAMEVA